MLLDFYVKHSSKHVQMLKPDLVSTIISLFFAVILMLFLYITGAGIGTVFGSLIIGYAREPLPQATAVLIRHLGFRPV